ncbi:MAG: Peroxisomal membrane protein PAS20 [Candelina submexicana]|nr:MAG: Peroxisomal membrane protein PAS20 [Candelina submexicana]
MASPSPPKPWERGGKPGPSLILHIALSSSAASSNSSTTSAPTISATSSSSDPPTLPQRPSTLNSVVNRTASNYSPYGTNRLGTSPYGGVGGYSSYTSPYSRFGGMGGSMYGGMGGMGGYGSMYGGMGGMGGMYGGMGGMGGPGDPNDPNSLTNSFSQSTQATFQIIESIVGAFGGFAQMLESTYMATHSSFFAMISVAEQFGNLRNTLGSILGIFTLMRWFRALFAKLTGRPPPADALALTPSAFARFEGRTLPSPDGTTTSKPSKKPFIIFLLAVFGLPYLMGKFIRALARSQDEEEKRRLAIGPNGEPLASQQQQLDPSKLEFCRLLYDFPPENGGAVEGVDLAVKKGDLVAVLSKSDPMGNASEWWRCRARDGRMGYLPSPYLESIQRRIEGKVSTSTGVSQAGSSRTATMMTKDVGKPDLSGDGKASDISVESFQKSQFYS